MAASAVMFRMNRLQVHQVLAVKTPARTGVSAMAWRPAWETDLRTPGRGAAAGTANGSAVIDLREHAGAAEGPHGGSSATHRV